jgi:hypothetical protein
LLTGLSQFLSVRIPLGLRLLVVSLTLQPIEEPGAEEKNPVVFTGLETAWVTVDKVGIPTFGLDGTQGPQDCRLSHLLPKAQA